MRKEMVGVVVVTHCHLAEEMICAAQLVVGEELKQFQPVSIDPKEGSRRSGKRSSRLSAKWMLDKGY
jgi:mannose/fructose-specific phosphotransferase system component IIA